MIRHVYQSSYQKQIHASTHDQQHYNFVHFFTNCDK